MINDYGIVGGEELFTEIIQIMLFNSVLIT